MNAVDQLVKEFSQFDTTSISDALDKLGIYGGLLGIKPVVQGKLFCGTAFTVHYVPCGLEKGTVGDFLDDVKPGQVVVIDNAGRDFCTVWGDLMSLYAMQHGIAGTVIDGVCRDVPAIRSMGYPLFSKGCYMVTGKDRVEVDAVNVPISISNVQVKPGDIIVGDDTGVLAIPLARAQEILDVAKNIAIKEKIIEEAVRSGMSLREARAKTGYHHLQTRNA